jgi:hypothetical protein
MQRLLLLQRKLPERRPSLGIHRHPHYALRLLLLLRPLHLLLLYHTQ